MSLSSRKIRPSLVLGAASILASSIGVAQLNPTVKVLPRANVTASADCDQGLSPAAASPRIVVSEIPEPAPASSMQAPPSARLRSLLRDTQNAADAGNRAAFHQDVEDLRAMVASHPRGGERDAAADALSVYEDLDKLWTYSFEAPTGAFFDATTNDGALLRMLNKYPEYGRFIARQTVTAGGTTLYPTTESRQFLAREAARRASLTSRAPAASAITRTPAATPAPKVARSPRPAARTASAAPVAAATTSASASAPPAPASATPAPRPHRSHRSASTSASVSKPRSTPRSTATPRSAPPPAPVSTPVPAPPPAPATLPTATSATSAPAPAPVTPAPTSTTAPTETTASTDTTYPTATETTATTATATATETTASATETTDTTATTGTTAAPAPAGRNLVIPIVLILIGLGVLILLFRASS